MSAFSFVRLLLLGMIWAISIVVLGIAANSIALSIAVVWNYPIVALVVAVLTHAISTPLVIISLAKTGAVTSRVVVELSWVVILWLLWLFVSIITSSTSVFSASCDIYRSFYGDDAGSQCLQFSALRGCAWANTAALFGYAILLFVLSIFSNIRNKGLASHTNAFFTDASLLRFSILTNKWTSVNATTAISSRSNDTEKLAVNGLPDYPSKTYDVNLTTSYRSSTPTLKAFEPFSSNPHAFWAEAQRISSLSSVSSSSSEAGVNLDSSSRAAMASPKRTTYTSLTAPAPAAVSTLQRQRSNRSTRTTRSSSSHGSSRGSVHRTYAPSPLSQVQPVVLTQERRYRDS